MEHQDKGKAKEQHKPENDQTVKHLEEVFGEDFEGQSTLGLIRIDPGTPPLGIDPISSNQKNPEIPEQSYCPPGNETVQSTIQYPPAIPSNAQNTVYFHTPESFPIGDPIAADEYNRQHAGILKEVLVSAPGDAGYAGVGAGVQREPRQKAQSSRRPVSFNGYTARPPVDERYPAQLSARSAPSLRHREQSSAYGQSDRGHESSPPVNGIPSRGSGEAKPNQKTLWDWIIQCFGRIGRKSDPDDDKKSINNYKRGSVGHRLHPTLKQAEREEIRYRIRASRLAYTLNAAIGVQVLLNALVTGLSASGTGKAISILGGAGTAISSYIARSRGTNEPQASEQRATDLQKFLRDINAFIGDHGDKDGLEHNSQITTFRERFNDILGNEVYQDAGLMRRKIQLGFQYPRGRHPV